MHSSHKGIISTEMLVLMRDVIQISEINSLAPGRFEQIFFVIFKLISVTDGWGISGKIALRWMPLDLTDDKSTLVQVMAWCRQATSQYLIQCWPRFKSPYGITRPKMNQWGSYDDCFMVTGCVKCCHFHVSTITILCWKKSALTFANINNNITQHRES